LGLERNEGDGGLSLFSLFYFQKYPIQEASSISFPIMKRKKKIKDRAHLCAPFDLLLHTHIS
jgi:hypothetical protein